MRSTARAIERMSLSHRVGDFIGAEDDLLVRLGVSRPTLRQAAKIVENDRMLSVRRGTRGGFYAARPDAADAVRTLARFLRLKGATMRHLMVTVAFAAEEAAAGAAACEDSGLRARLADFVGRIDGFRSPAEIVAAENELMSLIGLMSGNPALELVVAIGFSFGMEEHGLSLFEEPAVCEEVRRLQRGVCDSVLARDAEIARLMMQRRSRWVTASLG